MKIKAATHDAYGANKAVLCLLFEKHDQHSLES